MSLEERAAEVAADARCGVCSKVILDQPDATGALVVRIRALYSGLGENVQLCGMCGLAVREILNPTLKNNDRYQRIKAEMIRMWHA